MTTDKTEEIALTKTQINIIKHSLGIGRGGNRNYFFIDEGSTDFEPIEKLFKMGLMAKRTDTMSSDFVYHVTEKGKEFIQDLL